MRVAGIWDPQLVKSQVIKTAVESSCMLLRIDDIVSGITRKKQQGGGMQQQGAPDEDQGFGDQRDG